MDCCSRGVAKPEPPVKDTESLLPDGRSFPQQWQKFLSPGAGQWEYQGYDTWTPEEKQKFREGKLTAKWGIGQVSVRLPVAAGLSGGVDFIALVYGFLPFIIPIWWFLWAAITWIVNGCPRFFPAFGLCVAAGFALVNETVTKKLCRRFLDEDITNRPPEAVCNHPGMPSGHVMNAYTLMVWWLLEAVMDHAVFPEWLFIIILVMGPVPWARVHNKDHTRLQVTVSAVIATFMGIGAYCIRNHYFPNKHHPWDFLHGPYHMQSAKNWAPHLDFPAVTPSR